MNSEESPHQPRQERSRATAERLLNATIRILDESGLDGAVIPRIAAVAKVAPASVYRRFADKEALLRAAFMHVLKQSNQANHQQLKTLILRDTLASTSKCLITLLFKQFQQHPHLFRALSHFIDADSNSEFANEARSIMSANVDVIVEILLMHRSEIAHGLPESALRFAVLNVTCSIETFTLDPRSLWHTEPSTSESELAESLVHSFVAYLTTSQAA
ncbi:TetR/AcrR family transcriptional regulator [Glaciimonas soli]|nr:TetR/AcrR family transcriptional regulator [Glaciimonas soli]